MLYNVILVLLFYKTHFSLYIHVYVHIQKLSYFDEPCLHTNPEILMRNFGMGEQAPGQPGEVKR